MPELVECPTGGAGNLLTVSETSKEFSVLVSINHELGQSGDCSPPEHPEKNWNMLTISQPPGGVKRVCPQLGNSFQGSGPRKDNGSDTKLSPGSGGAGTRRNA